MCKELVVSDRRRGVRLLGEGGGTTTEGRMEGPRGPHALRPCWMRRSKVSGRLGPKTERRQVYEDERQEGVKERN